MASTRTPVRTRVKPSDFEGQTRTITRTKPYLNPYHAGGVQRDMSTRPDRARWWPLIVFRGQRESALPKAGTWRRHQSWVLREVRDLADDLAFVALGSNLGDSLAKVATPAVSPIRRS